VSSSTDQHVAERRVTATTLGGERGQSVPAKLIRTGTGTPIVFLHGLVGLNEHWEPVVDGVRDIAACTQLELPLLELRGDRCSIQGVTDLTTEFLEQHQDTPAILVGNSFGGHVALRIALERPDLVRGLVLAGSSGLIEKTFVRGAPVRPSREWLEEKIAELFFDRSKMSRTDVDRAYAALSQRGGARAMVRLSRTARRNHLGDRIGEISQPTLIIWGKDDVVTPPSAAKLFMDLLPDARIEWLESCGHAPMIEQPAGFAAGLRSFLLERFDAGASGS